MQMRVLTVVGGVDMFVRRKWGKMSGGACRFGRCLIIWQSSETFSKTIFGESLHCVMDDTYCPKLELEIFVYLLIGQIGVSIYYIIPRELAGIPEVEYLGRHLRSADLYIAVDHGVKIVKMA